MPVSPRGDPFANKVAEPTTHRLLTPQARVLAALVPAPNEARCDWPVLTRALLGIQAGYTAVSGSVTRALNGIRAGSTSGPPQTGLLALGYVEEFPLDIDGLVEVNYRITAAGIAAYTAYLAARGGRLPPVRDAALSTNNSPTRNNGRPYVAGRYRQGERRLP